MVAPWKGCRCGWLGNLSYSWWWTSWNSRASLPFRPVPRIPALPGQLYPPLASPPSPVVAPNPDLCQCRRSCGAFCCRAPRDSHRSRCRSDGNSSDRCSLCVIWSMRYSYGTWRAAPVESPGSTRAACTCACTNGFAMVAPRRTTCRLRNHRFESGIPAAWGKITFILVFSWSPHALFAPSRYSLRYIIRFIGFQQVWSKSTE